MKEFHGSASTRTDVMPYAVFELITDLGRLPQWKAIEAVVERPPALAQGVEWTVKMHPPHVPSWRSVSRVDDLDRHQLRFAYESRNADGNPSYTMWVWKVDGTGDGTEVTVTWDVYLKTLDRRVLAGPLRRRQLEREVAKSLRAITSEAVATRPK